MKLLERLNKYRSSALSYGLMVLLAFTGLLFSTANAHRTGDPNHDALTYAERVVRDGARETRYPGNYSCGDGTFCNGAERCEPALARPEHHGCVAGAPPCPGSENPYSSGIECSESERRCIDLRADCDRDGDGYLRDTGICRGDDCNDSDPRIHPGAREICDGNNINEDCDVNTLPIEDGDRDGEGYVDARC